MMSDAAIASLRISSAQAAASYSMTLQKDVMTDMEQQAMGELAMLPPTPGIGDFIDTYA